MIKKCKQLLEFTDKGGKTYKINIYADDTAVFLTRFREFKVFTQLYALYNQATGGQLNLNKTTIIAAGVGEVSSTKKPIRVKIGEPGIYLDIPIGSNIDTISFKSVFLAKLKDKIKRWKRKRHAISIKILIAKNCLLSIFWHSR